MNITKQKILNIILQVILIGFGVFYVLALSITFIEADTTSGKGIIYDKSNDLCGGRDRYAIDPESGQPIFLNKLIVLGPAPNLSESVYKLNGRISLFVPETMTYEICFPVATLSEIKNIRAILKAKGYNIILAIKIRTPVPGQPQ